MWHIQRLVDTSIQTLETLDVLVKQCFRTSHSLQQLREDQLKHGKNNALIVFTDTFDFVSQLTVYPQRREAYMSDVCVSPKGRNKGLFKTSLDVIKDHLVGYAITLDASVDMDGGVSEAQRIRIFQRAGFLVNDFADTWTDGMYNRVPVTPIFQDGIIVGCSSNGLRLPCPMILR